MLTVITNRRRHGNIFHTFLRHRYPDIFGPDFTPSLHDLIFFLSLGRTFLQPTRLLLYIFFLLFVWAEQIQAHKVAILFLSFSDSSLVLYEANRNLNTYIHPWNYSCFFSWFPITSTTCIQHHWPCTLENLKSPPKPSTPWTKALYAKMGYRPMVRMSHGSPTWLPHKV